MALTTAKTNQNKQKQKQTLIHHYSYDFSTRIFSVGIFVVLGVSFLQTNQTDTQNHSQQ
eukprot:m.138350 g.138350  ORF g.138350 m.138350 type:complete len:59 (-) comp15914_c1_seq4:351-527(-)